MAHPVGYAISLHGGGTATVNNNYMEKFAAVVFANTTDRNPRDLACGTVAFNEMDDNLRTYEYATNETFSSAFAIGSDGVVSQALGGLSTVPPLGPTGVLATNQRAATVTTLPAAVAARGRISLSTEHARPGQLFTLYCVAGGALAARPVILDAVGTAEFGEHADHGPLADPHNPGGSLLFGPQQMAGSAQLYGAALYYTATFMFMPSFPAADRV